MRKLIAKFMIIYVMITLFDLSIVIFIQASKQFNICELISTFRTKLNTYFRIINILFVVNFE
jgi:hypothetical protein